MMMTAFDQQDHFAISVPPPASVEVEYYSKIACTLIITNISSNRVLVEEVTLRFQSDSGQTVLNPSTICGWEMAPGDVREKQVEVTPTPLFLEATNVFDVRVKYRIINGGHIGDSNLEPYFKKSYIIIREPKTHIGQVFISLKQPEDLNLGRLMARMVRRSGLVPFLKSDHKRLSEDIWAATIEPALHSSKACIVIWTDKTNWIAKGVEREISFCRDSGIPEALFLEKDSLIPPLFAETDIEYMQFDAENCAEVFADGVNALRCRLQGSE